MKRRTGPSIQRDLFREPDTARLISDIQPLPRDPNQRRVKVGGRVVATLRASDVETMGLAVGQEWNAAMEKRVHEAVQADQARREAMRLLSRRPYSRKELCERLTRRGHDAVVVRRIADEAVRDGWLNERAYADDIVRGVTSRRPAGRRLIEEKLRERGVEDGVARQVLSETNAAQEDLRAACELGRRRLATMHTAPAEAALRRIAALLARRGFEEEVVEAAVERLRSICEPPRDQRR